MSHKKNKKNKTKKEKIIWYDDNSTIADMSAVSGTKGNAPGSAKPRSTFKDKWNTYWSTVKLMLLPTTFVLGVIAALYVIIMLITGGFGSCA